MLSASEEFTLQAAEVEKVVRPIIEKRLLNERYDEKKVQGWIDAICADSVQRLHQLEKPYKFAVTCVIAQRTGAAVFSSNACFWDSVSDMAHTVLWPPRGAPDANSRALFCIVTVFACSFSPSS